MRALLFCLLSFLFCSCSTNSKDLSGTKTYRIARDPSWYPLVLQGLEAPILGFTDDLLNHIAKKEQFKIEYVSASWDALNQGLKQGRYDVIATSMPEVLANVENYSFSNIYLPLGPVLIVPQNTLNGDLESFKGREAGVLDGSIAEIQILEKIPTLSIHTYPNYPSLLQDLVNGNIDVALMPSLIASGYVRDLYFNELKIVGTPMTKEGLKVATLYEENEAFIQKFNESLSALIEDGTYDQLQKKWQLK